MKKILLLLFLISSNTYCAKPPDEVLTQMEILSRVEAAIQVCLNSPEYKKLPATEALKFHDVSIKASDIIEIIEKRYDDKYAYAAFMTASMQIGSTNDFKRDFNKTYSRKCAEQLLLDASGTLNTVRDRIKSLAKKK